MTGCGDGHAASFGVGITHPGLVAALVGAAEPVCAASEDLVYEAKGWVETPCYADLDLWLLENRGLSPEVIIVG